MDAMAEEPRRGRAPEPQAELICSECLQRIAAPRSRVWQEFRTHVQAGHPRGGPRASFEILDGPEPEAE